MIIRIFLFFLLALVVNQSPCIAEEPPLQSQDLVLNSPISLARTALITGANRGLGLSLTRQLLDDGINVIAVVRNKSILETLSQKYPNLKIIEADLSKIEEIIHIADIVHVAKIDYL